MHYYTKMFSNFLNSRQNIETREGEILDFGASILAQFYILIIIYIYIYIYIYIKDIAFSQNFWLVSCKWLEQ